MLQKKQRVHCADTQAKENIQWKTSQINVLHSLIHVKRAFDDANIKSSIKPRSEQVQHDMAERKEKYRKSIAASALQK